MSLTFSFSCPICSCRFFIQQAWSRWTFSNILHWLTGGATENKQKNLVRRRGYNSKRMIAFKEESNYIDKKCFLTAIKITIAFANYRLTLNIKLNTFANRTTTWYYPKKQKTIAHKIWILVKVFTFSKTHQWTWLQQSVLLLKSYISGFSSVLFKNSPNICLSYYLFLAKETFQSKFISNIFQFPSR